MKVPFLDLKAVNSAHKSEIVSEISSIIDQEWYILGKKLEAFEKSYAAVNEVQFCVGVGNGLDALVIALKTLGIGAGDEVIVPSNTFIATALAVSYVGATPVLAEPNPLTYNISALEIEKCISKKTKAIIPVHLYGQSCEMTGIMDLAKKHSLFVLEDNAQAQGATYKGKQTGSWGEINATSFYPGKNLGALGDAGAITTDRKDLAELAKNYRSYGSQKKYHHAVLGQNSRLDEIQAAALSVKLKHLKAATAERQSLAANYNREMSNIEGLVLPKIAAEATHVYHLYVIQTAQRDQLQKHLSEAGIDTLVHYPIPLHKQEAYKNLYNKVSLPVSEKLCESILSLPIYPGLSSNAQNYVIEKIVQFYSK